VLGLALYGWIMAWQKNNLRPTPVTLPETSPQQSRREYQAS
jgi:hypothetical protein